MPVLPKLRPTPGAIDRLIARIQRLTTVLGFRTRFAPKHLPRALLMSFTAGVVLLYLDTGGVRTQLARLWADGTLTDDARATAFVHFLSARLASEVFPQVTLGAFAVQFILAALTADIIEHVGASVMACWTGKSSVRPLAS